MASGFYSGSSRGSNDFNNIMQGLAQISGNREDGQARRLSNDVFERGILDSVSNARQKVQNELATSKAAAAAPDMLDLYKFKYEMFDGDRKYGLDRDTLNVNKSKIDRENQMLDGQMAARQNAGRIAVGGNVAQQISNQAWLDKFDPAGVAGQVALARGAGDHEISRIRSAIDGQYLGDSESVSLDGQGDKQYRDLIAKLVETEFSNQSAAKYESEKPPALKEISGLNLSRMNEIAGSRIDPSDPTSGLEILNRVSSAARMRGQEAGADAFRQTGDELAGAMAMLEAISGSSAPQASGGIPLFRSSRIPELPVGQAGVQPTPMDVQNLVMNPSPENARRFYEMFGEEAYRQVAGQ